VALLRGLEDARADRHLDLAVTLESNDRHGVSFYLARCGRQR
jgi:hypothetical protein